MSAPRRPTSVTKRDLRRDELAAALISPRGDLAARTLEGVYGLAAVQGWSRTEAWVALLDLQREGRVQLMPMAAHANLRIVLTEPPAQTNLFEDGAA